jgi:uncharacterized membrane protein
MRAYGGTLVVEMPEAPYSAALTLGAVSGMRSMMAPAVISWAARKSGLDLESTPFSAYRGPGVGKTAVTLALGELLADGTHYAPVRTDSAALLATAVAGGAAGVAVFKARRHSILVGALVGAGAALGAAYAAQYLRKKAARYFDVSDRAVAMMEDGIALGAGLIAVAITKNGDKHLAANERE